MKQYITDDFLLETKTARRLYHEYAEGMPIVDYHCHLSPKEVAEDRRWENMAQVWLHGDHYKWRVMRANGVEERYCTGDASDREKFQRYAETMPYLLRNPLYVWSHLELARYFGIHDILSDDTAEHVWKKTAKRFARPEMSARGLMRQSGVRLVCTTDDPVDDLAAHKAVAAAKGFKTKMLPTWRPDKAFAIHRGEFWNGWVDTLASVAKVKIAGFDDFLEALQRRHDVFAAAGCRLSDYGMEEPCAEAYTLAAVRRIFAKARKGTPPTAGEARQFRSAMLYECGKMDAASDWTWQIHYNVLRNTNPRMFAKLGPDTGYDSMADFSASQAFHALFGRLDAEGALPRTILYSLNPCDNEMLASLCGNYQGGAIPGKMQLGSGWWYNDQKDGMERQMEALSNIGLLSRFVGMLTDSRSFLSYARHEYFRRILCNLFGNDIEKGLLPNDVPWVGEVVKDICYRNAERYFGFRLS
ncbi:MAG: glucuronate isomerase [Kiritimatiellaeota bacterium]|nr:glucuronate isomerase [Kiritimatiellota bacterium]